MYIYIYIHRETMGSGRGGFLTWWQRPKLWMGGGEKFGDDEISVSKFRCLPKIFGGGVLLIGSRIPPSKWQLRAKMRRKKLPQISASDGFLQPVLLDSAFSSCCCTFSSNLCVVMAEQLCSHQWWNSFVQGKIWDHPSNMIQK